MAFGICGTESLLFRHKSGGWEATKNSDVPKNQKEVAGLMIDGPYGWAGNLLFMVELQKKILSFRDIIDLPPCNGSGPINELLIRTTEDLHRLYPKVVASIPISHMNEVPVHQGLEYFYNALKSVGDSWADKHKWLTKFKCKQDGIPENIGSEQFGERVLEKLDHMIKVASEMFDVMDEENQKDYKGSQESTYRDILNESYSDNKATYCHSPVTPTTVLPELTHSSAKFGEFADFSYSPPLLLPLRLQAVGKLKPIDVKRLAFHTFPHVTAQGSSLMNQMSKTYDKPEPEIQKAKKPEIAKPDPGSKEETRDCKAANETQEITMFDSNQMTSNNGGSANSCSPPKKSGHPLPPPIIATSEPTLQSPPPPPSQPPTLAPNVSAEPPVPTLLPNVVEAAALLPPQPSKFLSNVSPPPPTLQPNATATPPPPPTLPSDKSMRTPPPPPPPSPPTLPSNATATPPPPPPPMMLAKGGAPPPPPPLSVTKALRPKKANTKLKRSIHMGNLYRVLKGKVEGSSVDGKSSVGRKSQIGGCAGGKQSMADALAEMTKRSAYFQQIEEDVKKHATSIMEMKRAINSFQTKDMAELLQFHLYVELHLEDLTDETQVLARFDDFPTKKLETLRMAAALYSRLNAIATNLESWKIVAPLGQLFDRVECYFNKIKVEVDALERNKDEESKRFQSHNIHFNFNVLVRIKESMVDVSSSCMELALKERRESKAAASGETGSKTDTQSKACIKLLWRAFQLAFRVYTFAGGQDDRADRLTRELAHEIETDPHH